MYYLFYYIFIITSVLSEISCFFPHVVCIIKNDEKIINKSCQLSKMWSNSALPKVYWTTITFLFQCVLYILVSKQRQRNVNVSLTQKSRGIRERNVVNRLFSRLCCPRTSTCRPSASLAGATVLITPSTSTVSTQAGHNILYTTKLAKQSCFITVMWIGIWWRDSGWRINSAYNQKLYSKCTYYFSRWREKVWDRLWPYSFENHTSVWRGRRPSPITTHRY